MTSDNQNNDSNNNQDNPFIPEQIQQMIAVVNKIMSSGKDVTIDSKAIIQIAKSVVQNSNSPVSPLIDTDKNKYLNYYRASSLWIDSISDIVPRNSLTSNIYSRIQFINLVSPAIISLVHPIANKFSDELIRITKERFGDDKLPDFGITSGNFSSIISGNNSDPAKIVRSIGIVAFTMQIGQVVGNLALNANTSTDLSLCLLKDNYLGFLPNNIKNYARSIDVSEDNVAQYFVLKENAKVRLFNSSKWLKTYLQSIIGNYAKSITINTDLIEEQMNQMQSQKISPFMNPTSANNVFDLTKSDKQTEELEKIELVLALIESWTNIITEQAGIAHIPNIMKLLEMSKREFTEGKTLQPLTSTIGIKVSPGIYNKAQKIIALILSQKGSLGRDAIWSHPDMLPTREALESPLDYINGKLNKPKKQGSPDWDNEFSDLLNK
ncbi:MAG: zinc-dependent metalloprotease [Bifidobacteriaceae bacterium]|jgi:putative hydrolase|nr:zinc-dependent metalloprotease [Bifidobacteriaceae bacterium]